MSIRPATTNLRRYALVLAAVALAVLAKLLLDPVIVEEEPFLLFLGVVAISAWMGGAGPGFVATTLTTIAADYFFIAPRYQFTLLEFSKGLRLALFFMEGSLITLLVSMVHAAIAQRNESRKRYQSIVENAEEGIWLLNPTHITQFANAAMADMLGYSQIELVGRSIFEFVDEQEHAAATALFDAHGPGSKRRELRFRHRNGSVIWTLVSIATVDDAMPESDSILAIILDITARKHAEEELLRYREHLELLVHDQTEVIRESYERLRFSEQMAAVGTLAAGLGHDMGNLLFPLEARLESIEAKRPAAEVSEDVTAIRQYAEYLRRITQGLRLLSSNPDRAGYSSESTDLPSWWNDVAALFKNAVPRRVTVHAEIPHDLPSVAIPASLLTQSIFNLVQNAGAAMETTGGTVHVRARLDPGEQRISIAVQDTGPGMDEQTKRRCLEPFFTTKNSGASMGFGLTLVHLIVRKFDGTIEIESAPGSGTTFLLKLPVHAPKDAHDPTPVATGARV